jgi:hypothetical protein
MREEEEEERDKERRREGRREKKRGTKGGEKEEDSDLVRNVARGLSVKSRSSIGQEPSGYLIKSAQVEGEGQMGPGKSERDEPRGNYYSF